MCLKLRTGKREVQTSNLKGPDGLRDPSDPTFEVTEQATLPVTGFHVLSHESTLRSLSTCIFSNRCQDVWMSMKLGELGLS